MHNNYVYLSKIIVKVTYSLYVLHYICFNAIQTPFPPKICSKYAYMNRIIYIMAMIITYYTLLIMTWSRFLTES